VVTQGRNSFSPGQTATKYTLQFSDDVASLLFYKREEESTDAANKRRDDITSIYPRQCYSTSAMLVRPGKLKQMIQIENKIVKNPEANQLAIYKRGRGFEPGAPEIQVQVTNPGSGQNGTRTRDRGVASPTR